MHLGLHAVLVVELTPELQPLLHLWLWCWHLHEHEHELSKAYSF